MSQAAQLCSLTCSVCKPMDQTHYQPVSRRLVLWDLTSNPGDAQPYPGCGTVISTQCESVAVQILQQALNSSFVVRL